ncbi:2-phospho-L-lactate guanylyltransferase [Fundidesulfovibrio magnetotacticus]|uniref:2-phospho-L-lactate guanylyltransferase n=1 Tax=Fundidesulfovibrio magnetotacticus TaxID=2730080 RepID=A0A6V8LTQ4_9BACT|nr:TIGR04282 family arsenosugar biosynthesis glycosyltransferase [Fundidesulfovibrio magnetotacticus]GFK93961.1 2-phospho-L-lactate guanylyltransferase [Fundidesulfovibrio magnetotacticus]
MRPDVRLLLMLRAPLEGRVKTRLARDVGDRAALALYRAMVEDVLEALDGAGARVALLVEPGAEIPLVRRWLGEGRECVAQRGAHLGERLENAFAWAFAAGCDAAAAVGSDVPCLSPGAAGLLVEGLRAGRACLGPSPDGGYWTVGFTRGNFLPEVFRDMPWSEPGLLARTLEVMAPLDPFVLPELADVDTLADLGRALGACPEGLARRTRAAARAAGLPPAAPGQVPGQ